MSPQSPDRPAPKAAASPSWSRRAWLKAAAVITGTVAGLPSGRPAAAKKRAEPAAALPKRWGMVIDLDKCTACGACLVACAVENNVPLGDAELALQGRVIRWIHLVSSTEGEYPFVRQRVAPIPCQHCDRPPCIAVCPVKATYKNPEGLVAQIYPRCIGCRYCVNACPYTCKYFNWFAPEWPEEIRPSLNPEVSVRPKGVTEKCSFCHHRLQRAREQAAAEERDLEPGDYVPACVEACPAQALYFGDLNDPHSEVRQRARARRAFHLLEELGTEPKVTYLAEE